MLELGFVLARLARDEAKWRKKLAAIKSKNEVARALALVLGGRAAAEKHARSELDHAHVTDDVAWAKKRLLDPKTAPSWPSAWLLHLGGDELIDKYLGRLDSIDARFLVQQLEKLGSQRAASALLEIWTKREDVRDAVVHAFTTRPRAAAELAAHAKTFPKAVKALATRG